MKYISVKQWNWFYQAGKTYTQLPEPLLDAILQAAGNPKTALDLGCGRGELVAQLNARRIEAFGVDPSDIAIKMARKAYPKLTFEQAGYNYIYGHIDIVFLKLVLAFLDNKRQVVKQLTTAKTAVIITPVRFKGQTYDSHYKRISLDLDKANELLGKPWSIQYSSDSNGALAIYILKNK